MKCFSCKKAEAEAFCDCLIVERMSEVQHTVWGDDMTVTENRKGIYSVGLCPACLKKQLPFFQRLTGQKDPGAFSGIGTQGRAHKPGQLMVTVPMKEGFYKNAAHFRKVNQIISEDEANGIYHDLVENDKWKQVKEKQGTPAEDIADIRIYSSPLDLLTPERMAGKVAAMTMQKLQYDAGRKPAGNSKADSSPVSQAVEELLKLYRAHPGGFLTGSSAAEPVCDVGERLNEEGGMDMMLKAHKQFAARCGSIGPGLARNLEMVWDGIGEWRG